MKIFINSFVQVALVAANTVFLSRGYLLGMVVSSFGINWLWTRNVRNTAFGTEADRVLYAVGATCGCLFGYFISKIFVE